MSKLVIYAGISIGGIAGAYLPVVLFHVSAFGAFSIIAGFVGSVAGLWAGWKLTQWIDS